MDDNHIRRLIWYAASGALSGIAGILFFYWRIMPVTILYLILCVFWARAWIMAFINWPEPYCHPKEEIELYDLLLEDGVIIGDSRDLAHFDDPVYDWLRDLVEERDHDLERPPEPL